MVGEQVSLSPGFGDAIPAFILTGAYRCHFAAKRHGELDPVLPHLPQLAGQIRHLKTDTGESRAPNPIVWAYSPNQHFKPLYKADSNRKPEVQAINVNRDFIITHPVKDIGKRIKV